MRRQLRNTAAVVFLSAASVYTGRAIAGNFSAAPAGSKPPTEVKLIEDVDSLSSPTTTPSTAPSAPAVPVQNSDGTFSLNIIAGADLVEQLRMIGLQAEMNIIPSSQVRGTLPAMDLYNVTPHEALDALLHANGYAWREQGKFVYVYSAKEIADMEKAARVANTEVFHLYYTPAANAVTMVKPVLSADAQVAVTTPATVGIPTGVSESGGDSHSTDDMLVVTDYPENLDRVRQVLREVDRRPQQILIEATILRASLSEDNALGIDFNVVGGVDFSSISTSNGQLTNSAVGANGQVAGGNGTVRSVGTGNSFSGGINNGLKVGVVTNNVSIFLSALEGITDTTVLANPKILALNKQRGEVIVGKETGYITTTTTETTSTQTVQFLDTGTRLVFRPFIGDDGYVRMEVHPEDSDGGLQTAQNLPFKNTTEVTTNVMVKDGHTIVIGGLFRDDATSTRSQIPVLGNLPLAGPLFRQQRDTTTRDELIILITPHIVKDDDAYARLSTDELKEAEKLRVGVRKGMMFWGRTRLAESHYESAVQELSKTNPDRKKALWDLDAATNLNPKFIEAINLKQDLTGKEITDADNSSIRSFVARAILVDQAPATQPALAEPMSNESAVAEPATQPVALAPATTQPADVAIKDEQADEETNEEQLIETPVAKPATQPTLAEYWTGVSNWLDQTWTTVREHADELPAPTAVTELPQDEIPSASSNAHGDGE